MTAESAAAPSQAQMANWKNVNNWHWVEKNCLEWARKYLTDALTAIPSQSLLPYENVSVASVTDIEGDVDLNVRKGKVRYLFDLQLRLSITGDLGGEKRDCKVHMVECTFDEEPKDYEYTYTSTDDEFRKLVESKYAPSIWNVFKSFPQELLKANADSLLVEASSGPGNEKQLDAPVSVKPAVPALDKKEAPAVAKGPTASIDIHEDFKCSPSDIFAALTNVDRLSAWTHSPCQFELKADAPFVLFGGAVTGTVLAFDAGKSLKLKWRLTAWAKECLSTVTFTIQNRGDYVRLVLEQTGVPQSEQETIPAAWKSMYFERIKHVFGYVY